MKTVLPFTIAIIFALTYISPSAGVRDALLIIGTQLFAMIGGVWLTLFAELQFVDGSHGELYALVGVSRVGAVLRMRPKILTVAIKVVGKDGERAAVIVLVIPALYKLLCHRG